MFDDQPIQPSGAVPGNLPIAPANQEPEDMFSRLDETAGVADAALATPAQPPLPSALSMGALKPKSAPTRSISAPAPQLELPNDSEPPQTPSPYPTKGPMLSRVLIAFLFIIIIGGILGGGGWYVYVKFFRQVPTATPNTASIPPALPAPVPSPVTSPESALTPPADATDSELLFGEPIDSDGDGLDDAREKQLGIDPQNWDTDHDSLSDSDEVTIWKTDPKNADTDGDTYSDGEEVKNGYNPAGAGKIFEPRTPSSQ